MKKVFLAFACFAIALAALAELSKYKDWDKTPEAYFLTPAERAEWKNVTTDEDAAKFIALYYAKRGGKPFEDGLKRRIAAADEQFKGRRQKGSESARGRVFIVLGNPSRLLQSQPGASDGEATPDTGLGVPGASTGADEPKVQTWLYDKDKFDPSWNVGELRARISVNPQRGNDELQNAAAVDRALAIVAEKSIVNPNATVPAAGAPAVAAVPPSVPSTPSGTGTAAPGPGAAAAPAPGAAAAPAPGAAAAPAPGAAPAPATGAAPAPATGAALAPAAAAVVPLPAAAKSALEAAAGKASGDAGFWSGPFRSGKGDSFLAIQFYLASNKPAFASGAPLKYGALITDESGKEVQSVWEDAVFSEVAEGSRKDRVLDRSVALPPGSYKGTFGLFPAEGQPPVASASTSFKLDPPTTEFEVSPLILSAGLVPLTRRPGPTDPFVFGTEKPIKVEPKGDKTFSKQDSLWYFYAVGNPAAAGGAAAAPDASGAAAPAPAGGTAAPPPAADAPKPRIMTRINVQRDGQDAFAPFTGPADMQPISGGHYGTGSEIPLASFEPGYYTFAILVRDLNAAKGSPASKGIERKEDFIVLMPDGNLPPKKAAGAAPAPKPTAKKP